MNILEIPFVKLLDITKDKNSLELTPKECLTNHLNTLHAGALYTLAETQSGLYLQEKFKDLAKDAVPLLRGSTISYKKPTSTKVKAYASANQEELSSFKEQYLKRGRATITIKVELKDSDSLVIMIGEFKWFVSKI